MITLNIENTRSCKLTKNEEVRKGDNNISAFSIVFPSNFGAGHPRAECAVEMRCYLPNGEFLSYELDTSQPIATQPITYDLTEQEQQVSIMFIITHGVEVIGKTNSETLYVYDAPDSDREPLTPREDFDRVINEQRQTISSQAAKIDEQSETIGSQGERITELNGEVTELTTENGELRTQHTADQNTIQYLIDNPPEAHLQPKSVTPTSQMQVVEPDEGYQGLSTVTVGATTPPRLQSKQVAPSMSTSYVTADNGYDGLSSVTVDNVDASIDSDIQPENIKEGVDILGVEGTYNPFPEHSVGGIYITEVDEDGYPVRFLIKNFSRSPYNIPLFFSKTTAAVRALREIIFEDCPAFTALINDVLNNLTYLRKLKLPENTNIGSYQLSNMSSIEEIELGRNIKTIGNYCFYGLTTLKKINIPKSLTSIGDSSFSGATGLEIVTIESGFNCNGLNLSASTRYSHETILSWFNALADRTGKTAYTLTIGATNLNKLTNEQKAIAIGKNWNLA